MHKKTAPHTKNNLIIQLLVHPAPPVFDTKHASQTGTLACFLNKTEAADDKERYVRVGCHTI
ncbi:hypothetical protein, partial [Klebsiella pneumoniae]|uniref:hypothetical protein n=1 Tax=Klebsiella pneumoniae TaxID=573 RepID=UPI003F5E9B21